MNLMYLFISLLMESGLRLEIKYILLTPMAKLTLMITLATQQVYPQMAKLWL